MDKAMVIGITVTVALLVLVFYNINAGEMLHVIEGADPALLVLASVVYMTSFLPRGLRWKYLVRRRKNVGFWNSVSYTIIGWAGNNILPARAGEFLRAYVSGGKEGIGASFSLATILVERFIDVLSLVILLALIALLFPVPGWAAEIGILAAVLLAFAGAFLFLATTRAGNPLKRVGMLRGKFESFVSGLKVVGKREFGEVCLLSIVIRLIEGLVFYIAAFALGMGLDFISILFVMIVVSLGTILPSSPGYIGTFQFFTVLALSVLSVAGSTALAFAILVHIVQYIPVTFAGLILLHVNYSEIWAQSHQGLRKAFKL